VPARVGDEDAQALAGKRDARRSSVTSLPTETTWVMPPPAFRMGVMVRSVKNSSPLFFRLMNVPRKAPAVPSTTFDSSSICWILPLMRERHAHLNADASRRAFRTAPPG
jgi:hypothetical protein